MPSVCSVDTRSITSIIVNFHDVLDKYRVITDFGPINFKAFVKLLSLQYILL